MVLGGLVRCWDWGFGGQGTDYFFVPLGLVNDLSHRLKKWEGVVLLLKGQATGLVSHRTAIRS
jgi:hypothetical protein